LNRRAFWIAITAWSAKVDSKFTCLSISRRSRALGHLRSVSNARSRYPMLAGTQSRARPSRRPVNRLSTRDDMAAAPGGHRIGSSRFSGRG
jgi:hypothetical protein